MSDDDLKIHKSEPPKNEQEWQRFHRAAWRADRAWPIIKPIDAVVSNWKAIVAVVILIAWINSPEIMAAIQTLAGVK